MRRRIERCVRSLFSLVALVAVMSAALPLASAAGPTWALTQLTPRGVDKDSVETFAALLAGELSAERGWSVKRSPKSCSDVDCAVQVGRETGADYTVYGAVSKLGSATVVTVTAVEVASGDTVGSQKLKIDRLEDLDTVAERIASALRSGTHSDDTAELGSITHEEARPEVRREGDSGLLVRLGAVLPSRSPGYAEGLAGASIDLGLWYETLDFVIEPRIGVRFDARDEEASWVHGPIDVAGYYVFSRGDFAPFAGFGAGLHYLSEDRPVTIETGETIRTRTSTVLEEDVWAFGMFARAGVLFLRTYSVRMAVTVDYSFLVVDINQQSNPQAWNVGIATIF